LDAGNLSFITEETGLGSAERMRITSTGNVGIGTTTPATKLHVVGASDVVGFQVIGAQSYFQPSTTSANQGLQVDATNLAVGSNLIHLTTPVGWTGNFMSGNLNGVQKFKIDQNGLYTQASDARFKENVESIDGALDSLTRLRGVSYSWIGQDKSERSYGVIAQELREVFPDLVYRDDDAGYLSVNYIGLFAPIIESIKTLNNKCQMTEKQFDSIEKTVAGHQRRIASLEAENAVKGSKINTLTRENQEIKAHLDETNDRLDAKDRQNAELEQRLKKLEELIMAK